MNDDRPARLGGGIRGILIGDPASPGLRLRVHTDGEGWNDLKMSVWKQTRRRRRQEIRTGHVTQPQFPRFDRTSVDGDNALLPPARSASVDLSVCKVPDLA
jgi:hypothetical protein